MGSENNQKQNNQWGGHGEGAEPKRTGGGGGGTPEPTTGKSAAPELQFQSILPRDNADSSSSLEYQFSYLSPSGY